MTRLHVDATKDQLTWWIENALHCELFPQEKSSLANVELPPFVAVRSSLTTRAMTDETHVIALETSDGRVFSILVKVGDYTAVANEADDGTRA